RRERFKAELTAAKRAFRTTLPKKALEFLGEKMRDIGRVEKTSRGTFIYASIDISELHGHLRPHFPSPIHWSQSNMTLEKLENSILKRAKAAGWTIEIEKTRAVPQSTTSRDTWDGEVWVSAGTVEPGRPAKTYWNLSAKVVKSRAPS
ncbi:MAG: hypothetical protein KDD70_10170, partial [Bdellovibrionales bacterium]|nr:hypothetical protein [Bdellovibrionales bacterium]